MPLSLKRHGFGFVSLIACIFCFCSCERAMQAKVEGSNPPVFAIWSGTGKFWMVSVTEYLDDKSLKPSQRDHEIWRVDADGTDSAQYPSSIGKITYGIVPRGYHQSFPADGSPPALVAGNIIRSSSLPRMACLRAVILKYETEMRLSQTSNDPVPASKVTATKLKSPAKTPIDERGITSCCTGQLDSVLFKQSNCVAASVVFARRR